MPASRNVLYSPALRLKAGELEGVRELSEEVSDCVLPRFIIPPRGEQNTAQTTLFDVVDAPDIAVLLSAHWRHRPVLIDITHILDDYGRASARQWLPELFKRARQASVRAIPVVTLADLLRDDGPLYRDIIAHSEVIKFTVCVPSGELVGTEVRKRISTALQKLGLEASDCAIILDFGGDDFSDPNAVSPIITGALEDAQDIGPWQMIIFRGHTIPSKIQQQMVRS